MTTAPKSLNHIWGRLMRYAPWQLVGTLFLMAGRMLIQFVPALVIQRLFNELTATSQLSPTLWALVALLVGAALARVVILVSATWAHSTMSWLYSSLLCTNVLTHLTRRAGALTPPFPIGDLVNRLMHDATIVAVILNFTLLEAIGALAAGGAVYMMARIDAWVTVVALAPLVAAAIITHRTTQRLEQLQHTKRTADGAVSTFLGEVFGAVQAVQVAGATAHAARHLTALNATRRHAVLQQRFFQDVIMGSMINNISHVATGAFLLLAAGRMRDGTFSIGDFALFSYFLPVLSDFFMGLGMAVAHYKEADVSSQRLQTVMEGHADELAAPGSLEAPHTAEKHPSPPPATPHPTALLTASLLTSFDVQGLSYHHPSSGRGVEGATFALAPGRITVLTGRVGAGKSTLLRAMLGLLPAQAGAMWWNGERVEIAAEFFVPPRAAYVPQTPRLYSVALQENILLHRDAVSSAGDLASALHAAVLDVDIADFPEGLATVVGPRGMRLSGGQVQRAAAARALLGPPALLVVDDLSSALDVATEATLWQRLRALQGVTILAVSTRRITFDQADQIIVLKEGKVEGVGSLAALLASSQEMRHLYVSIDEPVDHSKDHFKD